MLVRLILPIQLLHLDPIFLKFLSRKQAFLSERHVLKTPKLPNFIIQHTVCVCVYNLCVCGVCEESVIISRDVLKQVGQMSEIDTCEFYTVL